MTKATKDTWKESMSFLTPTCEKHVAGDKERNFYPVSVATMFRARNMAKPLAQALRTLFAQNLTDRGHTQRVVQGASEEIVSAITPELARVRSSEGEKAISDLIEAFTDDKNAAVLGELIVDSLRDDFERGSMDEKSCLAFVKSMDGATLVEMLVGLAKGNRKLLGPFGEILSEALGRFAKRVSDVASALRILDDKAPEKTETSKTAS